MNNRIKASRKILIRYITSYYKAAARAENLKPNFYAGSAPSFWNKLCREKLEEECFAIHRIVYFGSISYNECVPGDLC
jgi:hypothetical protein